MISRRGFLALLAATPTAAIANNKGKKRIGGAGSSGKGGHYTNPRGTGKPAAQPKKR